MQTFLGASSTKEIIFVRGTTEGINLIAQTYGRKFSSRETRSCFPRSSIMRTSSPGK